MVKLIVEFGILEGNKEERGRREKEEHLIYWTFLNPTRRES